MVFIKKNIFKNFKTNFLLVLVFTTCTSLFAQDFTISGKVYEANSQEELIGANIVLLQLKDSTQVKGTSSDIDGSYLLQNVSTGKYILKVSYIGFATIYKNLTLFDSDLKNIDFQLF